MLSNVNREETRREEMLDQSPIKPRYEPPEVIRLTDLQLARGGGTCVSGVQGFRPVGTIK